MRISALEVVNYKGISRVAIDDLGSEAIVMISGRNGTGKSLLLEAIISAWSGRYSLHGHVGPWGDEVIVDLRIRFTSDEFAIVRDWYRRQTGSEPEIKEEYQVRVAMNRGGQDTGSVRDPLIDHVRNTAFRQEYSFGAIDFLPASRTMPFSNAPNVDLAMLNFDRVEQERTHMLDQFIQNRSVANLPNVANYLVTLDYQAFLADRQGLDIPDDYRTLANAFSDATGKTLLEPQYSPVLGSSIEVELPSGKRHALRDLSSGEQEMMALMYFVRRLSASGGILCLDEPEQHLHPTLQAALFEAMRDVADRAQLIVVSHSVNLIATAPLGALLQIAPPVSGLDNQALRLSKEPERSQLLNELGITPADLLQSDLILVVEGETDERWLNVMFPVELGRAHTVIAGSARQVVDAYDTLDKTPAGIPWLCLCDRDLLNDDELADLKARRPSLYVWARRELESNFLDATLLSAVLTSVGEETSVAVAEEKLRVAATPLMDEVLVALVEAELRRKHPGPQSSSEGDRFSRMVKQLREYAATHQLRADAVPDVLEQQRTLLEARWSNEWATLADPKAILGQIAAEVRIFKGPAALKDALAARIRDDEELRPSDLAVFHARIVTLLTTGPQQ